MLLFLPQLYNGVLLVLAPKTASFPTRHALSPALHMCTWFINQSIQQNVIKSEYFICMLVSQLIMGKLQHWIIELHNVASYQSINQSIYQSINQPTHVINWSTNYSIHKFLVVCHYFLNQLNRFISMRFENSHQNKDNLFNWFLATGASIAVKE